MKVTVVRTKDGVHLHMPKTGVLTIELPIIPRVDDTFECGEGCSALFSSDDDVVSPLFYVQDVTYNLENDKLVSITVWARNEEDMDE